MNHPGCPGLPELRLWLLDPANLIRASASEENTASCLSSHPYWSFAGAAPSLWPVGTFITRHKSSVAKTDTDFGPVVSGIVAIACAMRGGRASQSIPVILTLRRKWASGFECTAEPLACASDPGPGLLCRDWRDPTWFIAAG